MADDSYGGAGDAIITRLYIQVQILTLAHCTALHPLQHIRISGIIKWAPKECQYFHVSLGKLSILPVSLNPFQNFPLKNHLYILYNTNYTYILMYQSLISGHSFVRPCTYYINICTV